MAIDMLIRKKWDKFSLDINFKSQSKRIGILGASGCGKSMTLKSIAGIETPDSGHIKIDGNILFDKETKTNLKTQKRKVGYLFQNYALFPTMTVEQNIAAGLKGNKQDIHKRVKEMIQKFGLAGLEKHYPKQLSGGQQQRVMLARALAGKPKILILDDSTSAVDTRTDALIRKAFREEIPNTTKIIIAQRVSSIEDADQIIVLDDGKIMGVGTSEELLKTNDIYREVYESQVKGGEDDE